MANEQRITVTCLVAAPPDRAWRVFTDPGEIVRWHFASPTWHVPRATAELREGGTFVTRMEARDGSFGFDYGGVFLRVDPPRSLSYELGDGRRVDVDFSPEGPGTRVTETFDPESTNSHDFQRAGWQALLDNFARRADAPADPPGPASSAAPSSDRR